MTRPGRLFLGICYDCVQCAIAFGAVGGLLGVVR
jgi:hypothetical protein